MYKSVLIENLRAIKSLRVDGLRRINLIVGRNNTGKTTIQEGVFLLGGATNPVFPTTLGQLRGQRLGKSYPDAVWRPLFLNLDPKTPIRLQGRWENEPHDRCVEVEALDVTSFADALEPGTGGGGGIAAATQDFIIGGLRLRYTSASGSEVTTHATFDPRTGNIDAPSKERDDLNCFIHTGTNRPHALAIDPAAA